MFKNNENIPLATANLLLLNNNTTFTVDMEFWAKTNLAVVSRIKTTYKNEVP